MSTTISPIHPMFHSNYRVQVPNSGNRAVSGNRDALDTSSTIASTGFHEPCIHRHSSDLGMMPVFAMLFMVMAGAMFMVLSFRGCARCQQRDRWL